MTVIIHGRAKCGDGGSDKRYSVKMEESSDEEVAGESIGAWDEESKVSID
jgi:hypothetical protein